MASSSTVGDFVTLQRGTTYKGTLVGKPGPALLGLGSIRPGGGFREGDYKTYGGDCPGKLMLYPGDLFVSLKGATKDGEMIGSVARVPPSVPCGRLTQDTVKLEFRDSRGSAASFLYWMLRTPQYREYCAGRATGSAVVALSREDFLSFPLPSVTSDRSGLVELLEALERKIELNRQANEALEEMARAIFKNWFVNFNQIRIRAESRVPDGRVSDRAETVPEAVDSKMPLGWEVSSLASVTSKIGSGATPRGGAQVYTTDGCSFIRSQNVHDSDFRFDGLAHISAAAAHELRGVTVQEGDVLINITGDSILRTCMVDRDALPARVSQHVAIIRPKPGIPPRYLALHLLRTETKDALMGMDAGGTRKAVTKGHLESLPIVVPSPGVLKEFGDVLAPMDRLIQSNRSESRTLAALRDLLLPKLISGEIRLKDAEKELAAI